MKKKKTSPQIDWIIEQHREANHCYDDNLPYDFHLRMVVNVAEQFADSMPIGEPTGEHPLTYQDILLGAWGHDLLEDTHANYSDVKRVLGFSAAEIVYALTNEKGRYRADRANDQYYRGIVATPGATFCKLCDRIANLRYSKMMGSSMLAKYREENPHFETSLHRRIDPTNRLEPLFQCIDSLLKE